MLVCCISVRPARRAITADLEEVAAAADAPNLDNAIFATLVDDPANTLDIVDAFTGEIMLERASATDSVDGSLPTTSTVSITETASATDSSSVLASYTTWNPADLVNTALTNSNLTATFSGNSGVRAIKSYTSGKYYFEISADILTHTLIGIANASTNLGSVAGSGLGAAYLTPQNGNIAVNAGSSFGSLGARSNGDIIGIAVDVTNTLLWYRVAPSGNWNGSGTANPATGTGGMNISVVTGALYPLVAGDISAVGSKCTLNPGTSSFVGAVPSGFTSGWPA